MFVGVTDGQDREALTPWFVVGVTVMVLPSMVMVCQSTVSTVGGMIPSRLAVPVPLAGALLKPPAAARARETVEEGWSKPPEHMTKFVNRVAICAVHEGERQGTVVSQGLHFLRRIATGRSARPEREHDGRAAAWWGRSCVRSKLSLT